MIEANNLSEFVINFINSNSSSIIYFGIGTNYTGFNAKSFETDTKPIPQLWDYKTNQQFPPFLHDAKLKYFDKPILIVLVDPDFDSNLPPHIITQPNNFLENSWTCSSEYSNLYISSFNVSVIWIKKYIFSDDDVAFSTNPDYFSIKQTMIELCKFVSKPEIDSLLFYHEFTGTNTILFEDMIKKQFNSKYIYSELFDSGKICIDITRGADLSCYFDLANPENYPVITIDNNKLKYLNPFIIEQEHAKRIIKNFTGNSSMENILNDVSQIDLLNSSNDFILYYQLKKCDAIMLWLVENGLISMIRQFYTMNEKKLFGIRMWSVKYFDTIELKLYSESISTKFSELVSNLQLIDAINENSNDYEDYEDIFNGVKNIILVCLYEILSLILSNVLAKYNVDMIEINEFVDNLKNLTNKYDIIKTYKKFIESKIR